VRKWQRPLVLASGSPRRADLLAEAGFDATIVLPTLDDGVYTCGTMPVHDWVTTLAVLKARHVLEVSGIEVGTVLGADTVCVVDGIVLGQPADAKEARNMLHSMVERSHSVYTGWYLISANDEQVSFDCEVVKVTFGHIDVDEIDRYISTELWKGKAGAYNLSERVDAGWSITCDGDPTSVMGLPMERLKRELVWA
jgi:septum formation protein